jgi:hypothetical protein
MPRLLAVLLGGNCAPRSNTELHDVVFVAGDRIEDTYADLCELWFGTLPGLHVDSWVELDVVDGHRVTLARERPKAGPRLYFIDLGAYRPGEFAELHARSFLVGASEDEVKRRAKAAWNEAAARAGGLDSVHTDDLYEVDECLEIGEVSGRHVVLEPTDEPATTRPHNGWLPLPEDLLSGPDR